MPEPIEQRVKEYENLMDALMANIKVDIEDYVRDIATAAWNDAISTAAYEAETFGYDIGKSTGIRGEIADVIRGHSA